MMTAQESRRPRVQVVEKKKLCPDCLVGNAFTRQWRRGIYVCTQKNAYLCPYVVGMQVQILSKEIMEWWSNGVENASPCNGEKTFKTEFGVISRN